MKPLRIYKLADGTTRQYREGEQPLGAALVAVSDPAGKQTPEKRAAKAARTRRTTAKKAEE